MVRYNYTIFLITFLCMVSIGTSRYIIQSPTGDLVNVMEYGALGNGKDDDSQAFIKAWDVVCGATSRDNNGPTLYFPEGKTFLLKPIKFQGPCKSQNIHVKFRGVIIAPEKSEWSGYDLKAWLTFSKINGLTVDGDGLIDGNGVNWWKSCEHMMNECTRPTALEFNNCENLKMSGLRHKDSQRNHISISSCVNVVISDIHISAPDDSPNTDGIDISHSTNVHINNCFIGTGDDCIAINDGSSKINITSVSCGPGHGISVGSLGRDGQEQYVEDVHVKHCTFNATQNGARIKTWQGGSGYARSISFENITFIDARNPIIIDQSYCPHQSCSNEGSSKSAVMISHVSYTKLHGMSASEEAIVLNCDEHVSCTNIMFNHVNITSAAAGNSSSVATCRNAHGSSVDTFPQIKCLLP